MKKGLSLLTTGLMAASLFSATPLAFGADSNLNVDSQTTISQSSDNFLASFVNAPTNTSTSQAAFDVRAFVNHPCYNAVGAEVDFCLDTLGVETDFSSMIETNNLNESLLEWSLSRRCDNLFNQDLTRCNEQNANILPQLLGQLENSTTADTGSAVGSDTDSDVNDDENTEENTSANRYERSRRLWEMCAGHDESQAGCYQTFLRFVTDTSISTQDMEDVLR